MALKDQLDTFLTKKPQISDALYVAKSAELIGDVRLGKDVSVWPQCVLRGDINFIEIGEGTNVQDGTIVHLADDYPVKVGSNVTIGHAAIIHACEIGDECLIGMGATILDGAVIGRHSVVGANALVPKGMHVPERSLVMGVPAKVVREVKPEEVQAIQDSAQKYIATARYHVNLFSKG